MPVLKTVFIVGAGLSKYADLPLQSDFTALLLKANSFRKGKSRVLMPHLGKLVEDVFGFSPASDITLFPELEDVFTTIDLSANTGHHLGPHFPSARLRSLRRMLLSRIIRMLNSAYLEGKNKQSQDRELLLQLLRKVSDRGHQFVSLNWDVVLEGCFEELDRPFSPFYSHEIRPANIEGDTLVVEDRNKRQMLVAKMHGSINWLYCDCCRRTYSVPVNRVSRLASQVLKSAEEKKMYGEGRLARLTCPNCEVDLGVRLATFSYQKAMRTPMFESSWLEAEKALRRSPKWVFIGYSLPAADFEFKYLLKRVELARKDRPRIQVVTKRDANSKTESATVRSYKRFFGEHKIEFFLDGLSKDVISQII